MLNAIIFDIFILCVIVIALATAFIPFFLDENDRINKLFEEEDDV